MEKAASESVYVGRDTGAEEYLHSRDNRTHGIIPALRNMNLWSLPLTLLVCASSLGATIALHFLLPASIAEFVVAILAIISASSLTRTASRGIVLKLQDRDHELLSGIFNAVFGQEFLMP